MRNDNRFLRLVLIVVLPLLFAACPPSIKYPACENDDQCKTNAEGSEVNEYCLNKQCQQCREDAHCEGGEQCNNGRCEPKPECTSDKECGANKICQAQKCIDVQCTSNEDCKAGERCENNECVSGCSSDAQCQGGQQCVEGQCQEASSISASCKPTKSGDVVNLIDVHFDFNTDELRVDTRQALEANAECLKQGDAVSLVVEGHCDERGTQEYNLALGERRANAVIDYLRNLGVDASRMRSVSKGKNQPVCSSGTEACHEKNRRVLFLQKR